MEIGQKIDELNSISLGVSPSSGDKAIDLGRLFNALALLHVTLGEKSWVGLYLLHDDKLILGPFQGTPACEVIAFRKGVVGSCYEKKEVVAVEDVTKIENYICCDAAAKSEICAPIVKDGSIVGILDIDLPEVHRFSQEEIEFYRGFAKKIADLL